MITVADVLAVLEARADPVGRAPSPEDKLTGPASLDRAGLREFAFATLRALRDPARLRDCRAGLLIVESGALDRLHPGELRSVVVRSDNPRLDFIRVLQRHFAPTPQPPGIHSTAIVEAGADVSSLASIGPLCTIAADVSISEGAVLHGGVHVYSNTRIGRGVTVGSGCVIGASGFGYERDDEGVLQLFPQLGGVVIDDGAEIGSNTSIDRGALGDTVIGARARIDNLVHVAHNVQIGADAAVIAHAMLGGSVQIGERAWIAPSACIREGVQIGADAVVGLGAVVTADVPEGDVVLGNPARSQELQRSIQTTLKRLAIETDGASVASG